MEAERSDGKEHGYVWQYYGLACRNRTYRNAEMKLQLHGMV